MATEIERKYILKRLPKDLFKFYEPTVLEITQYYFEYDNVWNRFRVSKNKKTGKTKYIHTIKKALSFGSNDEQEKTVSEKVFQKRLAEFKDNHRVIKKTRYVVKFKGLKFEIDDFKDLSLTMLEVELPNINFPILFPTLLQKEILMEVTGYKQFSNLNLAFIHNKGEKKSGGKSGKRTK